MFNNNANQNRGNIGAPLQPGSNNGISPLGWKELGTRPPTPTRKMQRRILGILVILLLVSLIFSAVRIGSVASGNADQLAVQIGQQQPALVDLSESFPISPDLFGVNVFPETQSSSLDKPYSGFMSYAPAIAQSMANAHLNLLRFPGGEWGESENHILSCQQLNYFSSLLFETGAQGMIQARISNPGDSTGIYGALENNIPLAERADLAGAMVDYMNNPHSSHHNASLVISHNVNYNCASGPFHAVKLWAVGNEPDRLIDSDTGKPYTVKDYVETFIAYSLAMHRNDPTIKVFGPEISQYLGPNAGPFDADGQAWMEGFLKGVGAYEQQHHVVLLDGVSFHSYQFGNSDEAPGMLMSSPDEWNYLLPQLRQEVRQYLGRNIPIAITEINSNSGKNLPTHGQAALWWADTLGMLMNQQVEYVAFFSAEGVNTPYPLFSSTSPYTPTPMFRVMQLFSHLQPNLVPVAVQHDPISLYATESNAHDTVSLLFINKGSVPQLAHVSSQNQIFGVSPWHSMDVSIAPYSMALVTLHRNGDASAYSFDVPIASDTATPPLTYTACGNKTDPLANNIPC